jgi:hypothetical protein
MMGSYGYGGGAPLGMEWGMAAAGMGPGPSYHPSYLHGMPTEMVPPPLPMGYAEHNYDYASHPYGQPYGEAFGQPYNQAIASHHGHYGHLAPGIPLPPPPLPAQSAYVPPPPPPPLA